MRAIDVIQEARGVMGAVSRKMTVEELKAQLRRDLSVQKLFNKEITSQISISDKDITDFYNANKASFNLSDDYCKPQIHPPELVQPLGAERWL